MKKIWTNVTNVTAATLMGVAGAGALPAQEAAKAKLPPVKIEAVENAPPPPHVTLKGLSDTDLRKLTEKQLSALTEEQVGTLTDDQKHLLQFAQMHAWQKGNNRVLPTFFNLVTEVNPAYMKSMQFLIGFHALEKKGEEGFKEFTETITPEITGFSVEAPLGTMAGGLIIKTRDPRYKNLPPHTNADIAINKPGAEVHLTSDGKHVTIAFPDANRGKKNISLGFADIGKLYAEITKVSENGGAPDLSRSLVPWKDELPTHTDAIKLQQGNIGYLSFYTSPKAKINLKGLKGKEDAIIPVYGLGNATYIFDKDSAHVLLSVTGNGQSHATEPDQKKTIIIVPAATAKTLVVTETGGGVGNMDKDGVYHSGEAHIKLRAKAQGITIEVKGKYYIPDADDKKAGITQNGATSILRFMNDKGTHYVDVLLTDNGPLANPAGLERNIAAAAASLEREAKRR